jgi:hypothetical protein
MSSSAVEIVVPTAIHVILSDDSLTVDLSDGRTITVPLSWYPRLVHGTEQERATCQLIGRGEGIHWPQLDEDIKVEDLIAGRPSAETDSSLQRWLTERQR